MARNRGSTCEKEIYEHGEIYGVLSPTDFPDGPSVDAFCDKLEEAHPTWRVDWHNVGGRRVIKFIDSKQEKNEYERLKAKFA